MSDKKELVHKPNQTIMITNGEITPTQRKAYNALLKGANNQLKRNPNQILFSFSIADIKKNAGIHATDNWHLKNSLERLSKIQVSTVHENGDWCFFNLLAQVEKKGHGLEIQLPEKIRQALILNDYYTTLDLLIMKNLQGKYAIILYEFAMRYHKKQLPELTIEEFKELTGTAKTKSYENVNNLKTKVIEPAVKEINEKTDIRLSYSEIKTGTKTTSLKFKVALNKSFELDEPVQESLPDERAAEPAQVEKQYDNQSLALFELLPPDSQIEKNKVKLEKMLSEHSFIALKNDIEYCKKKKTTNFFAYFVKSVKSGHYSSEEIEKNEKKKEIVAKQLKLINEEKENKNKNAEMLENKAKEIIENMSKEDKEEYIKQYNSSKNYTKMTFESWLKTTIKLAIEEQSL